MNEKKETKQERYVSCCQILSIFASHANLNIDSSKEEYFFNDFACRFFQVLESHDQLCPKCLEFYKKLEKEFDEKTIKVKRNPKNIERAKLIMEELKKR